MTHLIKDNQTKLVSVIAQVNEKFVGEFIIDTGATYCMLTPHAAEVFGYKLENKKLINKDDDYLGKAILINLLLDGQECHNVEARIAPSLNLPPHISGLIGMSFLENFDRITFTKDGLELIG